MCMETKLWKPRIDDMNDMNPSVDDLTLEQKASLTSGGDAWHLQGIEDKGVGAPGGIASATGTADGWIGAEPSSHSATR